MVEVKVGGQTRRFRERLTKRAFNNASGGQGGERTSELWSVNGGRCDEVAVELRCIIAAADIAQHPEDPSPKTELTNRECGMRHFQAEEVPKTILCLTLG